MLSEHLGIHSRNEWVSLAPGGTHFLEEKPTLRGRTGFLPLPGSKALSLQPLTLKGVSRPWEVTWGAPTKL